MDDTQHTTQPTAPVEGGDSPKTGPQAGSMAQAIDALGLDEATASRFKQMLDDEVKNADAAGYLRGRNEKIELITRPLDPVASDDDSLPDAEPSHFPRYARRSVWDL